MLQRAFVYLSVLRELQVICVWIGLCLVMFDGCLYLGAVFGCCDVWVVVGYEGLGVIMALGSVWVIVDSLFGRTLAIDLASYAPVCVMYGVSV